MNVAIVAGRPAFHRYLQSELQQHRFRADFCSFYTAEMFFRIIKYRKFELVFLDEDIPDQDGLAVSEKLRERNEDSLVIFVTDRTDIIQKAFGTNVVAFIPRRQFGVQVPDLIKRIRAELGRRRTVVLQTVRSRTIRLSASEILYADLYDRHVIVHTAGCAYELKRTSMREVFEQLPENSFAYISRSCFVNLARIRTIRSRKLYLDGIRDPFMISRGRCSGLKKQLLCRG